ncbi:lysophospholipid acyltransferase family protein [Zhongshania aquimaris]|uniref:DUF374 domain-containing protein n=1 Tax=Zhongshania aquimaris TaxID=2857107 RepID=A0ABS6VLY7_9GAMM|nr:DUF374 domain-containing protein [Zhongshania aquimaris]MBW2939312.1 DUF374 domain-containing protein [Zhongshania aquimaris]
MARVNKPPKKIGPAQRFARLLLSGILQIFFWVMNTLRFKGQLALEQPCVMAVYHDELLPIIHRYKNQNIAAIASQNHFGYSIAMVMERYTYEVALGSPSRGGKDAFVQLLKAARKGKTVAFAVDGSRGPRHEMKAGAVVLAMRAKVPLYLIRADYQGWRIESTWDKSKFPKPFGNVTLHSERFPLEDFDGQDIERIVSAAEKRLAALLPDDYQPK